jgi:hypothetical protein
MFGVIVCPRCTLVQGADRTMARITCPRCGTKIEVGKAKVYFSTDSPLELAEGVRQVGGQLVYDIELPALPPDPTTTSVPRTDEQALRSLIHSLTPDGRETSREEIGRAFPGMGDDELDVLIARLLMAGGIYESSPGRYRPV